MPLRLYMGEITGLFKPLGHKSTPWACTWVGGRATAPQGGQPSSLVRGDLRYLRSLIDHQRLRFPKDDRLIDHNLGHPLQGRQIIHRI